MAISLETLALASQLKGGAGGGGGGGGSDLPSVSRNDNGKVLTVKNGRWKAVEPETELPDATGNNGKILGVVNGVWSVMDAPVTEDELPAVTAADNGKVLGVVNGVWGVVILPEAEDELPAAEATNNGKVLGIVNGAWGIMELPEVEDELPAVTTADNGKILGIVNGQWTVMAAPTVEDELPTVTASDNGKYLGVVNGQWTIVNAPSGGGSSGGSSVPAQSGTGTNSMIEGSLSGATANTASGDYSHAEGIAMTANHRSQHVFGEYNAADTSAALVSERGDYIEIVGNGYDEYSRSNARTLDWYGNETLGGNLTVSGGTLTIGNVELTAEKLEALLQMLQTAG